MPRLNSEIKKIKKEVNKILNEFKKNINKACKLKVEETFATNCISYLKVFLCEICALCNENGMKEEEFYKNQILQVKEKENNASIDNIKEMFENVKETISLKSALSISEESSCDIGGPFFSIYNSVSANCKLLEKREDVLVERCRKCLEYISEKREINPEIESKVISCFENVCKVRFGDKAKWPKNKKKGLAGLASILSRYKKLTSIVGYISRPGNVNKRSCLWPLVESSKKVEYCKNIERKYELLSECLNKVHKNIENKCSKLKVIKSNDIYDSDVMMLENLVRGKEGIKSQSFLTKFEVNKPPDDRNFISDFMNLLDRLKGNWFTQQVPELFFNSCYALNIKIGGESVVNKTDKQLFPNFYKLINRMKGKEG